MAKQAHYNASEHISAETAADPYDRPAFSFGNRAKRMVWNICHAMLFRPSPRRMFAWRAMLLRSFGAQLGDTCRFYPASKIWAPWNLICEDTVTVADGAEIYNPAPMRFGSHFIVSQQGYLCGASHDYDDPAFPLLAFEMRFGAYAWVCARASVAPGVSMGDGAVLGLGSVATQSMEPWTIYAGSPAVKIKPRKH